jgi:hypothetical protein
VSIQDERELRARLGGLLDGIDTVQAPVAVAVRQGRGIRMRRWVSAAVGLAVIVLGVVFVPGLIHQRPPAPAAPKHYTVTVTGLGSVQRGLIGEGTIDGRRWTIVLNSSRQNDGCSIDGFSLSCSAAGSSAAGARQVSLGSAGGRDIEFEYGTVGADVTGIVIQLSNGSRLNLRPVSAYGRRWVAFAAPSLAIGRAETFVGGTLYRYAVPFVNDGSSEFVTWLHPGQAGLARVSKSLGSGRLNGVSWHGAISIGPWGTCVVFANGSSCVPGASVPRLVPAGHLIASLACGLLYTSEGTSAHASSGVVAVPPGVRSVVLTFAGGRQHKLAAVSVGGTVAFVYAIPDAPAVTRIQELGAAGQLLASGSPTGLGC